MKKKRSIPMPLVILCMGLGLILGQIRGKRHKKQPKQVAAIEK